MAYRVSIVFNPRMAVGGGTYYMQAIEGASRSLAISPSAPVLNADGIEGAMTDLARERGGGLVVPPDAFTVFHSERIIALAVRRRFDSRFGSSKEGTPVM
jgi:hypothetical protein